jgi:hypothetical protein
MVIDTAMVLTRCFDKNKRTIVIAKAIFIGGLDHGRGTCSVFIDKKEVPA